MRRPDAKSAGTIPPAEPSERAAIAERELRERAGELNSPAEGGGQSPGQPGAAALDPETAARYSAAFAAVVEVSINGAARLVAARWPRTALFVGQNILPHVPTVADKAGAIGVVVGVAFPRALPAAGGVCSMLAMWLRALPPPKVVAATTDLKARAEPVPPPDAFTGGPG